MGYDEMEQAGPYLRRFLNDFDKLWYYNHWCPACEEPHQYAVDSEGRHWTFNHNYLKPTFLPSMLRSNNTPRNEQERMRRVNYTTCHYFIRDGKIEYCTDSPHHLAGKTIPLPEWPKKK